MASCTRGARERVRERETRAPCVCGGVAGTRAATVVEPGTPWLSKRPLPKVLNALEEEDEPLGALG